MNATNSILRSTTVLAMILVVAGAAQATLVTVPGTSNPYLAGMPNGTTANVTDLAPAESPVQVGIGLPAGWWLEFSAAGLVANSPLPNGSSAYDWTAGPDGSVSYIPDHQAGAEHSKSNVKAPIDALLGVFLDSSTPGGAAPSMLFFDTLAQRDYTSLSPLLKQVFFIGDGQTSGAVQQKVYIPAGATRLFLGVMDGFDWNNNQGSFCVNVNAVPEPATLALLALGGLALIQMGRRHARPARAGSLEK